MVNHDLNIYSNLDSTVMTGIIDMNAEDSRSLTELLMSQSPQPRRSGYGIMLYLPAVRDPLELFNIPVITIGRRDNRHQVYPTVDLSEHHAIQLGVSRTHAKIIFQDGCFYAVDLGSKNGTWVNKTQLVPNRPELITHRDSLRIGHLILHVGACQYA